MKNTLKVLLGIALLAVVLVVLTGCDWYYGTSNTSSQVEVANKLSAHLKNPY